VQQSENTVPAMVGPKIITSTEEIDSKLSNVMRQITNVQWNQLGTTDLSRPPSATVHNN